MDHHFIPPARKKNTNAVVVKYIIGGKGTFSSFNPHPAIKHTTNKTGVIFSKIFKEIGAKVQPPATNHDRLGVIITRGKTIDEAIEMATNAQIKMNIIIGNKKNHI